MDNLIKEFKFALGIVVILVAVNFVTNLAILSRVGNKDTGDCTTQTSYDYHEIRFTGNEEAM